MCRPSRDVVPPAGRREPTPRTDHAFVDGDKRLGWLGAVVFLDLNGHEPDLGDDDAFGLVMDVAAGAANVDDIAERLHIRPRLTSPGHH